MSDSRLGRAAGLPVVIPPNCFIEMMIRLIPLFTTAKAAARPSVGKPTSGGGRFSDSPFGRAAGLPVVIPANCFIGMMIRLIPNVCAHPFDRLPAD